MAGAQIMKEDAVTAIRAFRAPKNIAAIAEQSAAKVNLSLIRPLCSAYMALCRSNAYGNAQGAKWSGKHTKWLIIRIFAQSVGPLQKLFSKNQTESLLLHPL